MKAMMDFIFLVSLFSLNTSFKCGFDRIKKPEIKLITGKEEPKLRKMSSQPINIYVDYEILEKNTTSLQLSYFQSAFNLAIKTLQTYLKVKEHKTYSFSFEQMKSQLFDFEPSDVQNLLKNASSINADLYLIPYISYLGAGVDAAAYGMFFDRDSKRPVLGAIELSLYYNFGQKNSEKFLAMLLLHEITHILGFSDYLFPFFLGIKHPTIKADINGITRVLISTPKVLEKARGHFGCPSLEGVELENQGDEGSVGSHWEARIMLGDYMISTDYPEIVVSDITLALLEDSGWYDVNYYTGGLFKTGKGEGCNFLQLTCIDKNSETTRFPLDFCHNNTDEICSPGMIDRGYCGITSDNIRSEYKYFNSSKIGIFKPADYCPVLTPINGPLFKYKFYSRCDENGYKTLPSDIYEDFGNTNFCFQSSLLDRANNSVSENTKKYYANKLTARCMKVIQCYDNILTYTIKITENIEFNCTNATSQKTYEIEGF